jgi:DHA1 family bicyclomycin/chloramphenicol resistance-like MFS transporter
VSDDRLPLRLLVTLALLSATSPISTDLYLASFPQMARGLHTDAASVQLTLTAFLVGIGVGQVLWGPVTDHVGRYRPMIVGASLALVASVVSMLAPNVHVLIVARLVQALAGAACVTAGSASVADRLQGFALARTITLLGTIIGLAPIVAPVAGGLLAQSVSWRGVLAVICGFTLVQIVVILLVIRESLPASRRSPRIRYTRIGTLLLRPAYIGHAATQVLAFATLMTYVSSSSFVFERYLGFSSARYGLCFALNSVGLIAASFVSSRLARDHIHPARTVARALPVAVGAVLVLLVVVLSPVPRALMLAPLFVAIAALGFVTGNSGALAVQQSRDVAGSGSGLGGGLMFLVAGLISPLGGIAGEDTATPLAVVMLGTIVAASASFVAVRRYVARHDHLERAFQVPRPQNPKLTSAGTSPAPADKSPNT